MAQRISTGAAVLVWTSEESASREPDSAVTDTRETLPHTGRMKQLHLLKAVLWRPHMHSGT